MRTRQVRRGFAGGSSGGGGGSLHADLTDTGTAGHPIAAVSGLQAALDAKQAADADLTAIAGLDSSTAGAIATDGAGWIRKSYAALKTALGLVKADVGLGNVDNTSDANKPVSTATQTAIDAEASARAAADALLVPRLAGGQADLGAASGTGESAGTGLGDKAALYGDAYGFGIQAGRLVAYTGGSAGFAVRPSTFGTGGECSAGPDRVILYDDGDLESTVASKGLILKSANGTRYRITVADDGTLTTTAVT